jgi:diguanylate cyclase (GGDEF)-like protein
MTAFEENELCDSMIEIELLMKYQHYREASRRLEGVLTEHPTYLPAKEALQEICRRTGQGKKARDLQQEIRALSEQRAKDRLSPSAKEEYGKIEKRQFAEKVDQLIKLIYQSRNIDETLNLTAKELLDLLKADRCVVLFFEEQNLDRSQFEFCSPGVSVCLDKAMTDFLYQWFSQNPTFDSPIVSRNSQQDPSLSGYHELLQNHGIHALIAYPLIYKSAPMGWLVVQQCVPYYSWKESELSLFSTASGHLATAIQNLRSFTTLQDLAFRDNLTGLYNRHYLQERITVELTNAQATGQALSLALLDIDHFKHINDTYGHPAGDTILRKVGFLLKTNVRKGTVVARWGGEEFMVVFPGVEVETAALIIERFREKVSNTIEVEEHFITISAGLAQTDLTDKSPLDQIQSELIQRADENLYAAKKNGRNQVRWNTGLLAHGINTSRECR